MKSFKLNRVIALVVTALSLQVTLSAQTTAPTPTSANAVTETRQNTAIIPVPQVNNPWVPRQALVLQRAKDAPGTYDIEFIGDSITERWEGPGKAVWQKFYGNRKAINFGVSGDRIQHVLWRFENGQLDGIKAKVAVVMIGTNNSGTNDNTESEILEGITAIVQQIRNRQPDTKILLLNIFPRDQTFDAQRGKILQVNQALTRLDDGAHVFYLDLGSLFIENDGSISKTIMFDYLHPTEAGYQIWANAMEPKLKQLLAN